MKVYGEPTRSIRSLDNGTAVEIVDQTLLPYRFEKRVLGDWRDCVEAIRTMRVRGAPLIGITGAWAVVLAVKENPENVDTDQLARQQNDKTLACLKKHGIVDDSVTADAYDELATMGESGGTSFDDLIGKYALKDNPAYDKRKAAIIEQCGAL